MLTLYMISMLGALVFSAISCWPAALVLGVVAVALCFRDEARSLYERYRLRAVDRVPA